MLKHPWIISAHLMWHNRGNAYCFTSPFPDVMTWIFINLPFKGRNNQSVPPRQCYKLTAFVLTVCMAVPGAVLPRWGEWTPAKFAPLWWVQGEQEVEFHSTHFHLCFQNKISTKFDHRELFYWRVSALSCVQALKTYLTHNSMNSRQLMEKFFERKVWEQVREKPCRMYSSGLQSNI